MHACSSTLQRIFRGLLPILILPAALAAQAPERTPSPFTAAATASSAEVLRSPSHTAGFKMTSSSPSGVGPPLAGAVLGLPAGILTGAALGYLTGPRDDVGDGCMFLCVPSGPAMGALIGAAVGPGIGAHLVNGRRGNPWAAVAGSVLGTAGGFGLGFLVGFATNSTETGFAVAIPVAVGVPALAEWATSR